MIGKTLAHYRIVEQVGAGGMGEVYRAQDTQLGRDVALKLLPPAVAENPERLVRFRREAALLAALNHPNIATLHGLETADNVNFLVMELVEGEDLSRTLARGPLDLATSLDVARQVAAALRAAHEKGIVHRDLKPGNIRVTPDGTVKVLDFGLAKDFSATSEAGGLSHSPTMVTAARTEAGVIMGTAAYMSPEQARGKPLDTRTDVWSFGCVLYECLTGRAAFPGETVTDVLARILEREPDWSTLPAATPAVLRLLLRRALEKDVRRRWRDMSDISLLLDETTGLATEPAISSTTAPFPRHWMLGIAALLLGGVGYLVGARANRREGAATTSARMSFTALTLQSGVEEHPRLSPDGTFLVYSAGGEENRDIFLQRLGGFNPINLTPNSPADDYAPAYSPDGKWIAFRSSRDGGGLFVMGSTGESVRRLSDMGYDPAWSPDGRFLVAASEGVVSPLGRTTRSALWVIEVATGEKRVLAERDAVQPAWSPAGERIAYWSVEDATGGRRDLWTMRTDGSDPVPVTQDAAVDWKPVWSADGRYLYFVSDRAGSMNLWRLPIDEHSGQTRGVPEPLLAPAARVGEFDVSRDGRRIAYANASESSDIGRIGLRGEPRTAQPMEFVMRGSIGVVTARVSRAGDWIVFHAGGTQEDLYLVRSDGTGIRKLTDDAHRDRGPDWAPDGSRICFYSDRSGRYELWSIRPDGSGLEQLTRTQGRSLWFPLYSPDGSELLAVNENGTVVLDLSETPVDVENVSNLPALGDDLVFLASDWSPDGAALVGLANRNDGTSAPGVYVYSFATKTYAVFRRDLRRGSGVSWLPDGRHVIVIADKQLVEIDVRSGESRTLMAGIESWPAAISMPKDGSAVYLVTGNTQADIWLATME